MEAAAPPRSSTDGADHALHRLRYHLDVPHLAHLATCQRVMWLIADPPPQAEHALVDAYREIWDRTLPLPERFDDADAFAHLARVASSLDALVPGEPQILGQVRDAMRHADHADLLGPSLRQLFDRALHTAKEVRARTTLFRGQVSLLPLAQPAIDRALADAKTNDTASMVAILGTGVTGRQALQLVRRRCPTAEIHIVSRSAMRAQENALAHNATGHELIRFLEQPPERLRLVLSAIPTQRPFLTADWLTARANRHMLTVIDLALPRNTTRPDAPVAGLELVQMDDMTRRRQEHLAARRAAYDDALRILDEAVARQIATMERRAHADTLQRLTHRFQDIADQRWRHVQDDPRLGEDARKWYEQTVRALLHEAIQTVTHPGEETRP